MIIDHFQLWKSPFSITSHELGWKSLVCNLWQKCNVNTILERHFFLRYVHNIAWLDTYYSFRCGCQYNFKAYQMDDDLTPVGTRTGECIRTATQRSLFTSPHSFGSEGTSVSFKAEAEVCYNFISKILSV